MVLCKGWCVCVINYCSLERCLCLCFPYQDNAPLSFLLLGRIEHHLQLIVKNLQVSAPWIATPRRTPWKLACLCSDIRRAWRALLIYKIKVFFFSIISVINQSLLKGQQHYLITNPKAATRNLELFYIC